MSHQREHREKVLARIGATLRPGDPAAEYVKTTPGTMDLIEAIACKCCGCDIRRLFPTNRVVEMGGEKLRLATLATLPGYRDVLLTFEDGSAHHTCCCADCLGKGLTPEDLERLYAGDLRRWWIEEEQFGHPVRWDAVAGRKITGYKEGAL